MVTWRGNGDPSRWMKIALCALSADNEGREEDKARVIPCATWTCPSRSFGGGAGLAHSFPGGAHLRKVRWKIQSSSKRGLRGMTPEG